VEVGYFLHPAAWGFGYATELMSACTDLADHAPELREVRAFARSENDRSRRVLERASFAVLKYVPEMDRLLYRRGRLSASAAQ
jgi:[ribosomal protein S5]-alanine N-acetyltransferase